MAADTEFRHLQQFLTRIPIGRLGNSLLPSSDVCRELTNEKKGVEIRCGADKRTEEETAAFFVSNGTSSG